MLLGAWGHTLHSTLCSLQISHCAQSESSLCCCFYDGGQQQALIDKLEWLLRQLPGASCLPFAGSMGPHLA